MTAAEQLTNLRQILASRPEPQKWLLYGIPLEPHLKDLTPAEVFQIMELHTEKAVEDATIAARLEAVGKAFPRGKRTSG